VTGNRVAAPAFRVRWRIFSLLVSFAIFVVLVAGLCANVVVHA
jgi:putative copper export protein